MKYRVEVRGKSHYVIGLSDMGEDSSIHPDTLLVYHYEGSGDIDTYMRNDHMCYGALFDLYQTHTGLHDGDLFETPYGDYVCSGVHLVRVSTKPTGNA